MCTTFTRGKQPRAWHCFTIENVAVMTAWLPTTEARVAITSTGQNTGPEWKETTWQECYTVEHKKHENQLLMVMRELTRNWVIETVLNAFYVHRQKNSLAHVLYHKARIYNTSEDELQKGKPWSDPLHAQETANCYVTWLQLSDTTRRRGVKHNNYMKKFHILT